jgi:hypothetical protein
MIRGSGCVVRSLVGTWGPTGIGKVLARRPPARSLLRWAADVRACRLRCIASHRDRERREVQALGCHPASAQSWPLTAELQMRK